MSSKKNQTNALKAEDVVQAVLLADNFTEKYWPLASRWLDGSNPMVIHIQTAEDCLSLGDVMRDLDAKALIQSDFLSLLLACPTKRRARRGAPQRLAAGQRGKVTLPLHIFQAASAVEVRYDLLDPGISICSPNVPQLFSDNFDFQTRDHFVKGIIVNEEILGSTIYYKCLSADYAAQISGLKRAGDGDVIRRDVMDRWAYPVVPENRGHTSHIRCIQRNVYRHRTATVGRDSRLEESVALADGVIVGLRCRLLRAVVGPGCRLGDDVVLEDAVLDLRPDVVLEPGCVLGPGVVVDEMRTLPAALPSEPVAVPAVSSELVPYQQCRLTRCRTGSARELVGDSGRGFVYAAVPYQQCPSDPVPYRQCRCSTTRVLDSLVRGYSEKIRTENLILEVNSSKFAYNVTVQELNSLVVKAILSVPEHGCDQPLPPPAFLAKLQSVLATFMPLLANYIKNEESEWSCLRALETFSCEHAAMAACLAKVLMVLYQKDILSETTILAWYNESQELTPEAVRVRQQVRRLVEWLEQADEESEDDSGSDDD
ncbi:translation initiation factor eIF-2B subunit epsilon-like [Pollicipes pollicipes]|uniref:translation initiation factor eIF-2B subunit epsilon-like n=1 Tax=Pollicipes pollicipes TaxID=41117 RepID=UPI0018859321|nr:translation initiation factor eIF-2B subunit epsilon-like [Pollicipes pollicipes]